VPAHRVVANTRRAEADVIRALGAAGVATVHEAQSRRGLVDPAIRPIQLDVAVAGSAVTVSSHPGDNLMLHAAVEQCQAGDVLVVTTTSHSTDGMFGDLLASSLMARGVTTLVTGAGVRDTAELRRMGFSVWTGAISAQGTVKASPGSVNVPVVLGGQLVRPGDVVVADDDGVVVVDRRRAREIADLAQVRLASEADKRAKLTAGVLGLDMYELRGLLSELGVVYLDEPADADASVQP